jgi:hypothetical protein
MHVNPDCFDPRGDTETEFRDYRYSMHKMLKLCIQDLRVLDKDRALDIVLESLFASNDIRRQESHFYLLTLIGEVRGPKSGTGADGNQQLLDPPDHKIFLLLDGLGTLVNRTPTPEQQQITKDNFQSGQETKELLWWVQTRAATLIGCLSKWILARADKHLQGSLDVLCRVLLSPVDERPMYMIRAASESFAKICKNSITQGRVDVNVPDQNGVMQRQQRIMQTSPLVKFIDQLLLVYEKTLPMIDHFDVKVNLNIIEGVATILSKCFGGSEESNQQFKVCIERMVTLLIGGLQNPGATTRQLEDILDMIVVITNQFSKESLGENRGFSNNPPGSQILEVGEIFAQVLVQHIFPIANQLLIAHYQVENLIERVTRFMKFMIRTFPRTFQDKVPVYGDMLMRVFNQKEHGAILHSTEILIEQYGNANIAGRNQQLEDYLVNLTEFLAEKAYKTLESQSLANQQNQQNQQLGLNNSGLLNTSNLNNSGLGGNESGGQGTQKDRNGMDPELVEDFYGMLAKFCENIQNRVKDSAVIPRAIEMSFEALEVR